MKTIILLPIFLCSCCCFIRFRNQNFKCFKQWCYLSEFEFSCIRFLRKKSCSRSLNQTKRNEIRSRRQIKLFYNHGPSLPPWTIFIARHTTYIFVLSPFNPPVVSQLNRQIDRHEQVFFSSVSLVLSSTWLLVIIARASGLQRFVGGRLASYMEWMVVCTTMLLI